MKDKNLLPPVKYQILGNVIARLCVEHDLETIKGDYLSIKIAKLLYKAKVKIPKL